MGDEITTVRGERSRGGAGGKGDGDGGGGGGGGRRGFFFVFR